MRAKTISENSKLERVELKGNNCSILVADLYIGLSDYLGMLHPGNIFLEKDFFSALESAPPSNTRYKYVVVLKHNQPIGMLYFQYKRINPDLSLGLDRAVSKNPKEWIGNKLKLNLAKLLRSNVLVCGNMTLTGSNAAYFEKEIESSDDMIISICDEVKKIIEAEGVSIRATLIKDFYADQPLKNYGEFNEFSVQPNMIFKVRDHWKTFDDYICDMRSKYRVRVRRARKKSCHLKMRVLHLDEIRAHEKDLSRLYHNVVDHASFNLFILPEDYFYQLKNHLGDDFDLFGYFDGDKMVGFSTIIYNYEASDAHFLGYDPAYNQECLLYLNMLYDLIAMAIKKGSNQLIMSRTAMAIKSSVGAEPHEMLLYMKASCGMINKILKSSLDYLQPEVDWVPRSPFK